MQLLTTDRYPCSSVSWARASKAVSFLLGHHNPPCPDMPGWRCMVGGGCMSLGPEGGIPSVHVEERAKRLHQAAGTVAVRLALLDDAHSVRSFFGTA
jgi:hypothetical protein